MQALRILLQYNSILTAKYAKYAKYAKSFVGNLANFAVRMFLLGMARRRLCALCALCGSMLLGIEQISAQSARQVKPKAGLVITRSTRLTPGTYRLAAPASLDSALITVRGDDITLDLRGVVLEGIAPSADPDQAQGAAIRIEGGRNERVVGATARGYRIALMARKTTRLVLDSNDFS